ncbi:MAG: hypothetical protein AB8F34_09785 [Akkermansiaceae bacterium]
MLARENPFATDRVEKLLRFNPEWSGTSWAKLDKKWNLLGRHATITGRHGSGKTCFLDAWAARHTEMTGYQTLRIFLNHEQKTMSDLQWNDLSQCDGKIIILDGEEQLNFRARSKFYKLTKNATGILVTRHSQGRLPTLIHLDPNMAVLSTCVKKLAPAQYKELAPLLPELWRKHHRNIRHILLECYDSSAWNGQADKP